MRANKKLVDAPAGGGSTGTDTFMHSGEQITIKYTTANSRLIGDDQNWDIPTRKQSQRVECTRQPLEFLPALYIVGALTVDGAVPIQKDCLHAFTHKRVQTLLKHVPLPRLPASVGAWRT